MTVLVPESSITVGGTSSVCCCRSSDPRLGGAFSASTVNRHRSRANSVTGLSASGERCPFRSKMSGAGLLGRVDWGMGAAGWGRKPARLAYYPFSGNLKPAGGRARILCARAVSPWRHAGRVGKLAWLIRPRHACGTDRRCALARRASPPGVLGQQPTAELLELTRPARRRTSWPLCVSPPRGTEAASRSSTTIDPVEPWLDLAERRGLGLGSSGGVSAWRRWPIALAGSRRTSSCPTATRSPRIRAARVPAW